jgi:hypothetical protein
MFCGIKHNYPFGCTAMYNYSPVPSKDFSVNVHGIPKLSIIFAAVNVHGTPASLSEFPGGMKKKPGQHRDPVRSNENKVQL